MELSDRLIISKPIYIKEPHSLCGYCRGSKPKDNNYFALQSWYDVHNRGNSAIDEVEINNCTLGIHVELISVAQYDELCNLGFRRSGKYLYKPDLLRNCCRLYTIRTTLNQCKLSKELKTCVKRFKKFTNAVGNIPQELLANNQGSGGGGGGGGSSSSKQKNQSFDLIKELYFAEKYSLNGEFYTQFEPSLFTQEKYELFVKYQTTVHNDRDSSVENFKDFLCHAPFAEDVVLGTEEEWEELNSWKDVYFAQAGLDAKLGSGSSSINNKSGGTNPDSNGSNNPGFNINNDDRQSTTRKHKKTRYGPVHECYYHKGKLIALAVLDFLPTGISSVYFIWDPDYSKWNLGKISALKELALVSVLQRDYYYLGYYIDDCPKMMYKKKFGGDLLDVCNNQYVPIDKVEDYISEGKFFVLSNKNNEASTKNLRNNALFHNPSNTNLLATNTSNTTNTFNTTNNTTNGNIHAQSSRKSPSPVGAGSGSEEEDTYYDELEHCELPLNDTPIFDVNSPLINIAEKIYGEKEGYAIQNANESVAKLAEYGIEYPLMIFNDFYSLKPVIPTNVTDESLLQAQLPVSSVPQDEEDDGDIPGYTKEIYNIPTIIPGLLPLWQIVHFIESGEINRLNNKLMIYNTRTNQVRKVENFMRENKRVKKCICNVIRLIGLKATSKSLIII